MRADLNAPRLKRLSLLGAACALALTLASAPAAYAQAPGPEDLRALIYYLDHDDQRAVQAEMRRLRAQFPRWTPPGDVTDLRAMATTTGGSVDVQPIWARIERNDYVGARALIDEARARVPGWAPDAEMLRVLESNESQAAFDEAYARRDANAALAAVRRTPALLRCDRINNAWRMAELYQAAGQTPNAVTTYRGVVQSCTRLSDVVPTLEKANDIATLDELTQLFDVARTAAPSNRASLDELEARLRAGRGQAARPVTTAAAAGAPAVRAPAPAAAPPAAPVAAAPSVPAPAAAPAAAGQLPVRGDGRITQVRALKEAGNWAGCLAASAAPRSLDVLYERAWCAYNLERAGEALAGFSAVAPRGTALGPDVTRDARFGMILSYLNLQMTEEGARLAAATDLTRQQRIEVESTILDQRAVRSFHARDYAQTAAYLNALEQLSGSLRRDLAMLRGYAYLNAGQHQLALAEFTRLNDALSTEETRSALQSLRSIMSGL